MHACSINFNFQFNHRSSRNFDSFEIAYIIADNSPSKFCSSCGNQFVALGNTCVSSCSLRTSQFTYMMKESPLSKLLSILHRLAQHQTLLSPKPKLLHLRLDPTPKYHLNRSNKALLKLQADHYLDLLHQEALKYRRALLPEALKTLSSMETNVSVRSDSDLLTVNACLSLFLNQ